MYSDKAASLVHSHLDAVYGFCLHLTKNTYDAEELCQDTFLKIIEKPERIDDGNNPRAYICTVALSLWKSRIRKLLRRHAIAPSSPIDEHINVSAKDDTESDVLNRERAQKVNEAVAALPENLRIPVLLYYMCDVPLADIAKTLNCPVGTVKSRLYKAREIIKKDLEVLLND